MVLGGVEGCEGKTELRAGRADCGAFMGPLMRPGPAYPQIWSWCVCVCRGGGHPQVLGWREDRGPLSLQQRVLVTAKTLDTFTRERRWMVKGAAKDQEEWAAEGVGSRRAEGS